MSYVDEDIIRQRELAEQKQKLQSLEKTVVEEEYQSVFNGEVLLDGQSVTFTERLLFEDKVAVWMPEDFVTFSPEQIARIYILGNKPELVFGNSSLKFSIGFHYTEQRLSDAYMGEFSKLARVMLEQSGPKVRIISEKIKKTQNHTISSLELISHSIVDAIYNILFFCSLDERVLIGFLNFNYESFEIYGAVAKEILQSFRFMDETEVKEIFVDMEGQEPV